MNSDTKGQHDIVIIGGGIVGVATAALLAELGHPDPYADDETETSPIVTTKDSE